MSFDRVFGGEKLRKIGNILVRHIWCYNVDGFLSRAFDLKHIGIFDNKHF